jgi:hypothetical protein
MLQSTGRRDDERLLSLRATNDTSLGLLARVLVVKTP